MATGETGITTESSPRRRILSAAVGLFYRQGIQATGVTELCDAAHVSKRTLYQLYGGKDELVAAYLELLHERGTPSEQALDRPGLTPRERLVALFDRPDPERFRGCPFHNAGVELTDADHPARPVITAHKAAFLARLADIASAAGCHHPDTVGRQLLVLFEGATALATTLNDLSPFDFARPIAAHLVDEAVNG